MVHVLGAEEVACDASENNHSDKRRNLYFRQEGLHVDRTDFSSLERYSLHHDLNEHASQGSEHDDHEKGLNVLPGRASYLSVSTS